MSPESKQIPEKPHVMPEAKAPPLKPQQYYDEISQALDRRFYCCDPGRVVYSATAPSEPPAKKQRTYTFGNSRKNTC